MAIWDPLFNETGWNKVGTVHRTSRLISLALLPNPECPKYGPTGAKKGQKMAENSILSTQISSYGIFWVGLGVKRLEHQ